MLINFKFDLQYLLITNLKINLNLIFKYIKHNYFIIELL